MAIYLHCPDCKSTLDVKTKVCKRLVTTDGIQRQCGHVFGAKGKKYRVVVSEGGKRFSKIAPNLELAKKLETKLKAKIFEGNFDLKAKEIPILKSIWKHYKNKYSHKNRSWKNTEYIYHKHIEIRFANKRLNEIEPLHIESFKINLEKSVSKRGKPYSAASIKHIIFLISRMYSLANDLSLYQGPNPAKVTLKKINLDNEVDSSLSQNQVFSLLTTLDKWPNRESANFIKFLIYTGMRRSELFRLIWSDIDFEKRTVLIRAPKGNKTMKIPLSDNAIDVLKEIDRKEGVESVFPGRDGTERKDFKGPWNRIKVIAGIPNSFRLHDIRHHFATTLINEGVDLYTVGQLLTHKSTSTTKRYAHLRDGTMREAIRISDRINSLKKNS
ncbi:MAG: site-specific integrase [Desulfobulbaceae bacterium]|nr:site-specific integrase [Desulfobulbaceae bacterium]